MAVAFVLLTSTARSACNHSTSAPWTSVQEFALTLRAYSVGEVCGKTAVVLNVETTEGDVLWSTSRLAAYVSVFASDGTVSDADVKKSLTDWIDIGQRGALTSTGKLPDWPEGADGPKLENDDGFGFVANEDLSREFYLEQRKADRPMFCFVQGMESEACIIFTEQNAVLDFGGTRFPG